MKRTIFLLCVSLLSFTLSYGQQNDLLKSIENRYWAYENSTWDADKNSVHTFVELVNEGQVLAKGTGMVFDENGTFHEIADATKIGSKPCQGTWEPENKNTLRVNCGGHVWHYKILKVEKGSLLLTIKK